MGKLFDEDMICIQSVSCDGVTLQVVKMNVTRPLECSLLLNQSEHHTCIFPGINIASRHLVPNVNVLRKHDLLSINHVAVVMYYWRRKQ